MQNVLLFIEEKKQCEYNVFLERLRGTLELRSGGVKAGFRKFSLLSSQGAPGLSNFQSKAERSQMQAG